jgi:hypothetical protein
MAQDQTKKEALFNEVKGSLFEYLVAKHLAQKSGEELEFHHSLDQNYLTVLSQQDRMVRQFYPEMTPFLSNASRETAERIFNFFELPLSKIRLMGKFTNSSVGSDLKEADIIFQCADRVVPLSLKLNKRQAYVNTKSGGVKSFFKQYFSFIDDQVQAEFNRLIDLEFTRMASKLHELHEIEYCGHFHDWIALGLSELPGELAEVDREVLKGYYARIAHEMHNILTRAQQLNAHAFSCSLLPLMGFGDEKMMQVICFHDFKGSRQFEVEIHEAKDLSHKLLEAKLMEFKDIASVVVQVADWELQIRVKPMNKFTTTAIKINCSIKVMPPSSF